MVHNTLLSAYSTEMLKDTSNDVVQGGIDAHPMSKQALTLLGSWLYSGNLEVSCVDDKIVQPLVELYIFAHVHDFPALRNTIIHRLWYFYHGGWGFYTDALPSAEEVDHIFDALPADSELCILILELMANHWAPDHGTESAKQPFKPQNRAFLHALVDRQATLRYQAWNQPDEVCDCRFPYHSEEAGVEEPADDAPGEPGHQKRVKAWLDWDRGPRQWLSSKADPDADADSEAETNRGGWQASETM